MSQTLKDEASLEKSGVVANNKMNRERGLTGGNSYEKELGYEITSLLRGAGPQFGWLDVACGSGRALNDAAQLFPHVAITGIDLVDFNEIEVGKGNIEFVEISASEFMPQREFDLITCVHGFHYFGDKIRILQKLLASLTSDGVFIANFDLSSIKFQESDSKDLLAELFVEHGFEYENRILRIMRNKAISFPFVYLGSRDDVGPNYTGQPAVDSYYGLDRR